MKFTPTKPFFSTHIPKVGSGLDRLFTTKQVMCESTKRILNRTLISSFFHQVLPCEFNRNMGHNQRLTFGGIIYGK